MSWSRGFRGVRSLTLTFDCCICKRFAIVTGYFSDTNPTGNGKNNFYHGCIEWFRKSHG